MYLALLLQSSPAEPLAETIVQRALLMVARGDFTFCSEALGFRLDLVTQDGVDRHTGTRGAIFRVQAENPFSHKLAKVTFAVPQLTIHEIRRQPSAPAATIWS
jgi:hypothetical protein